MATQAPQAASPKSINRYRPNSTAEISARYDGRMRATDPLIAAIERQRLQNVGGRLLRFLLQTRQQKIHAFLLPAHGDASSNARRTGLRPRTAMPLSRSARRTRAAIPKRQRGRFRAIASDAFPDTGYESDRSLRRLQAATTEALGNHFLLIARSTFNLNRSSASPRRPHRQGLHGPDRGP